MFKQVLKQKCDTYYNLINIYEQNISSRSSRMLLMQSLVVSSSPSAMPFMTETESNERETVPQWHNLFWSHFRPLQQCPHKCETWPHAQTRMQRSEAADNTVVLDSDLVEVSIVWNGSGAVCISAMSEWWIPSHHILSIRPPKWSILSSLTISSHQTPINSSHWSINTIHGEVTTLCKESVHVLHDPLVVKQKGKVLKSWHSQELWADSTKGRNVFLARLHSQWMIFCQDKCAAATPINEQTNSLACIRTTGLRCWGT